MSAADPLGGLSPDGREPAPARSPDAVARGPAPRPLSTLLLLATLAAWFGVELWLSPAHDALDPLTLYRMGSLHQPSVAAGDLWRLGSYAFLHIGLVHFVVNGAALWVLMRPLEAAFGGALALGLFAASALAGGAASALHARLAGDLFLQAAGASGGIFGLFGATGAVFFRLRHKLPREAVRRAAGALLANLALNAVLAFYAPVDNYAHAGGLVAGALCALAIAHPALPARPWQPPARWALLACTFALAAMGGAAAARSARPAERTLRADGLVARAPYLLPQPTPGGRAVSAVGLSAAIFHDDAPPPAGGGAVRERGGRRWVEVPLENRSWTRARVLLAPDGAGSMGVAVRCDQEVCRELVEGTADFIAGTLVRPP